MSNALNSVEKDKDYEDVPAEAHLLLYILLRRVHVDDLIAQGPQNDHLQNADEARHSQAHVVVVHERLLIALADEFAHVEAHCPREANWNHEGQQAETAHDGLCRDRGGRKITREQREEVKGPPAPNPHEHAHHAAVELGTQVCRRACRKQLHMPCLLVRLDEAREVDLNNEVAADELG